MDFEELLEQCPDDLIHYLVKSGTKLLGTFKVKVCGLGALGPKPWNHRGGTAGGRPVGALSLLSVYAVRLRHCLETASTLSACVTVLSTACTLSAWVITGSSKGRGVASCNRDTSIAKARRSDV